MAKRKSSRETLEPSRVSYVDLFDFSPVSYALLNSAGMVVNISLAGCRLIGVERARVLGHPLHAFVIPPDRREFLEHLRRSRASTETIESELRFQSASGTPITCRLYTKAATYEGGQALPTMIVDQTENRALDQARLEAERQKETAQRQTAIARESMLAKDRFLATVSHELRTPLAPALIAAGRLATWDEVPDVARQLAATIKRNIELEARLIDDLLDVARANDNRVDLKLETVDVHQVLRETVRICSSFAEIRRAALTLHPIAKAHYVRGDPARLRQVFWNLLNNAIKAVDPGGSVVVRSINVDNLLRVTVRDDGAGMEQALLDRLFTPFERQLIHQDSRGGLGLGLAICKGIVAAHGGQIWAASEGPGRGAMFGVELATVAPESASLTVPTRAENRTGLDPTPPRRNDASGARPRLLLVEDDADGSEMLTFLLSSAGWDVEVADSLEAAFERLSDGWDVVISDIKLPDGSGLDIARRVRALTTQPSRLVALSGFGSKDDLEASRDAGFDVHLVKPIDPDTLLRTLTEAPTPAQL